MMVLLLACLEAKHQLHNDSLVSEQKFLGFTMTWDGSKPAAKSPVASLCKTKWDF